MSHCSQMHYLVSIKVNPHLKTTKPTKQKPVHRAVCHTTYFFADKNILISRLPVNKDMFTIVH